MPHFQQNGLQIKTQDIHKVLKRIRPTQLKVPEKVKSGKKTLDLEITIGRKQHSLKHYRK